MALKIDDDKVEQMYQDITREVERPKGDLDQLIRNMPEVAFGMLSAPVMGPLLGMPQRIYAGEKATGFKKAKDKFINPVDLKSRFEIPDQAAKIRPFELEQLRSGQRATVKLEQLLEHPELFENYPEIRNLKVGKSESGKGSYFDRYTGEIGLGLDFRKNPDAVKQNVMHEVQHKVQNIEGFAHGGRSDYSKHLAPAAQIDLLKEAGTHLREGRIDKGKSLLKAAANLGDVDDIGAYLRLAGEVEARDVGLRSIMKPEEAKALAPYATQKAFPVTEWINPTRPQAEPGDVYWALKDVQSGLGKKTKLIQDFSNIESKPDLDRAIKRTPQYLRSFMDDLDIEGFLRSPYKRGE